MTHNFKHIITSGCSFSYCDSWPDELGAALNIPVTNYGCPSAGNTWISKSAIYGTQNLLDGGTKPENILVVVMWSGIDRKDLFISTETPRFDQLLSDTAANPVNFMDKDKTRRFWYTSSTGGYLLGSMSCGFNNEKINLFKAAIIRDYYCHEALAVESYDNFLRLQWYCQSKNIKLINLTFMDILHYPSYQYDRPGSCGLLTKDEYKNVDPLYNMIDFSKWVLWNGTGGSYEYARDNGLTFNDGMHPSPAAHAQYVIDFLLPAIKKL